MARQVAAFLGHCIATLGEEPVKPVRALNCELHGPRACRLNIGPCAENALIVDMTTNTPSERGVSGRECPAHSPKIRRAEPGLEMA